MSRQPVVEVGGYGISKSLLLDLTKIRVPYSNVPVEQAYIGKKLENDWTLHLISDASRTGYDGALFSVDIDGQPHYFIYHQGANNVKDIPSIARLANGKVPQQAPEACAFSNKAMEYIADRHPHQDVPVTQVGYSLGGALAMLACRQGQPLIAFDAPGCKKLLEKQGFDVEEVSGRTLEIISPHANAVNAHGKHIGNVLEAGGKYWQTDRVSIADYTRMSAHSHHIRTIGLSLAEMEDFTPAPAGETRRPTTVFNGFREYLSDSMGENPSLRERGLSATATVMGTLGLDKLITKLVVVSADTIAGAFSKELAEKGQPQESHRPATHPDVHQPSPRQTHAPHVEPEPAAPQKSHAAAVLAERERAVAAGQQR